MQGSTVTVQRQRLASINGSPHSSKQHASAGAGRTRPSAQAESNNKQGSAAVSMNINPAVSAQLDSMLPGQDGYITEEHMSYLSGGPFNRFALALKSGLDNEIDWACARLVPATHLANEQWSLTQYAPSLLEAILIVLERSRKELQAAMAAKNNKYVRSAIDRDIRQLVLGDSGLQMVSVRAVERTGLLATALFNISQVGDGPSLMAQDPRIMIEITHWMHAFPSDAFGLAGVKAEFLDTLDTVLPFTPQPPFDSAPVHRWPVFGSQEATMLDPLVLVETCLWEELVRLVYESQERKLVLGALRVMTQSVSWHPQLAREILELPVPKWAGNATQRYVGEIVNQRLSELILAPDAEIVGACLELLVNTVRLESMSKALDEELEAYALKKAAGTSAAAGPVGGSGSGSGKGANGLRRRKRLRGMSDAADASSGGESGTQTPIFGFRPLSRASSLAASGVNGLDASSSAGSEPSMLPDGLAALVALVMQQWVSAACVPAPVPMPPPQAAAAAAAGSGGASASNEATKGQGSANAPAPVSDASGGQQGMSAEQIKAAAGRPPTEPELREACTWVLLNYEFAQPANPQQSAHYVPMAELFSRYMIAKEGQTVPHIGRALTLNEMVRVVAAVFPKSSLHNIGNQQRQSGQPAADVFVALHLRPKAQHIVPIPAVAIDNGQQKPKQQQQQQQQVVATDQANGCKWTGCSDVFSSEEQALEHISSHIRAADACRWHSCNRIPGSAAMDAKALEKWLSRHVLVHGPFFAPERNPQPQSEPKTSAASDGCSTDLFALAKRIRDEKSRLLGLISPPLDSGTAAVGDDQQIQSPVVLQLTHQGIQVLEQLQKWADRRCGAQGESDRARVWRSGADVLERVAYVASKNILAAQFASRLLAVISRPNAL
ncbi:hypothetical protein LPJ56_000612 [Coemansia sp. RSA 2599]|nr:hypothetical protein LPJ56_000612 [Coemansia sp. RSA 2599]